MPTLHCFLCLDVCLGVSLLQVSRRSHFGLACTFCLVVWQRFTQASPSRLRGLFCWVPTLLYCYFFSKSVMQCKNRLDHITISCVTFCSLFLTSILYPWKQMHFFTTTRRCFCVLLILLCHQPSQLLRWYHNNIMGTGKFEHSHYLCPLCRVLFFFSVGNLGGEDVAWRMWVSSCMCTERQLLQEHSRLVMIDCEDR